MNQKTFDMLLSIKVDGILQLIEENKKLSSVESKIYLYSSELYSVLSQEKSKVWYYSPYQLFNMLISEKEEGVLLW